MQKVAEINLSTYKYKNFNVIKFLDCAIYIICHTKVIVDIAFYVAGICSTSRISMPTQLLLCVNLDSCCGVMSYELSHLFIM